MQLWETKSYLPPPIPPQWPPKLQTLEVPQQQMPEPMEIMVWQWGLCWAGGREGGRRPQRRGSPGRWSWLSGPGKEGWIIRRNSASLILIILNRHMYWEYQPLLTIFMKASRIGKKVHFDKNTHTYTNCSELAKLTDNWPTNITSSSTHAFIPL